MDEAGVGGSQVGSDALERVVSAFAGFRSAARGASDDEALFADVCRVIVESGYAVAWVGIAEDDEARRVRPVARAGVERAYIEGLDVSWSADDHRGRGPTGRAIREGRAQVNHDSAAQPELEPWREEHVGRGYRSSVAIPFHTPDGKVGALNVYASSPGAFDALESRLLEELVKDLEERLRCLEDKRGHVAVTAALRAAREQLAEARDVQHAALITAGIVHDLNNLLLVITANTATLRGSELTAEQIDAVEVLEEALDQASRLTRKLALLRRKAPTKRTELDVHDTLLRMRRILERAVGDAVRVELRASSERTRARVDETALEQVILNLATNARDAMPDGGDLRIETGTTTKDATGAPYVYVAVSDTGSGIAPELMPSIFEPYVTTKAAGRGTGIGLETVKRFVGDHGGWIDVDSEPGRGARFTLYLPAIASTAASRRAGAVLVVDDDPNVRWVLSLSLRALGYVVHDAGSLEEAVTSAAELREELGLLVTNVALCGSLAEVVRRVRSVKPDLPVLAMSGAELAEPVDPDELGRLVRESLDGRPNGAG